MEKLIKEVVYYFVLIILVIFIWKLFRYPPLFPYLYSAKPYKSTVINFANKDDSKNIIVYSINGEYINKLVENAKYCSRIFPRWKIRVYAPITINKQLYRTLLWYGCQVYIVKQDHYYKNDHLYWNYLPMGEPVTCIVRDPYSLLEQADHERVNSWIKSDKNIIDPDNLYTLGYRNQTNIWPEIEAMPYRRVSFQYHTFLDA